MEYFSVIYAILISIFIIESIFHSSSLKPRLIVHIYFHFYALLLTSTAHPMTCTNNSCFSPAAIQVAG